MRKSKGKPQHKQHEITEQRKRLRHLGCTEEQIERNVGPGTKKTEAPKKGRSRAKRAAGDAAGLRNAAAKRIRELTKRICELTKQWAENAIALGSEFRRVRDTFPVMGQKADVGAPTSSEPDHTKRPGWHEWIAKNTAWSHQQVGSFIRVAEKFGDRKLPANIRHSVLEYLARRCVPEEAREEVLDRAGECEKIVLERSWRISRPNCGRSTGSYLAASPFASTRTTLPRSSPWLRQRRISPFCYPKNARLTP